MKNTILVADDESHILRVLKFNLEKEGYNVFLAIDGKKALEMAFTEIPNLIILDITMPKHSGYEVCSILKNDPRTKLIPIILLTAKADDIDGKKGFMIGANSYETKPFSPKALLQKVKNLLEKN
ncbi:MAG: response regulator [bacterium]|nr:response regulator [bacterium]